MTLPTFVHRIAIGLLLLGLVLPAWAGESHGETLATRLASQHMERFPDPWLMRKSDGEYVWSYTHGLVLLGMERLYRQDGNDAFADYIQAYADHFIGADGNIESLRLTEFNIDSINAGKILFSLYERTGDERYRKAMDQLRLQLKWQPRTHSGGFWHKRKYPWQIWLDGLYMAQPFYAQYEKSLGNDPGAFDDIVNQFVVIEQKTRDAETGLLYHGWDESALQAWADSATGRSPGFWSRAMGWYAMALTDTVEHLPEGHHGREQLGAILNRLVSALIPFQHETGLWYQVPDQGDRDGNWLEASGSAMFVYAIAKGVRLGVLDGHYLVSARKGYAGLLQHIISIDADGTIHVNDVCRSAGLGGVPYRDGTYEYYVSTDRVSDDAHGIGAFLLAASEMTLPGLTEPYVDSPANTETDNNAAIDSFPGAEGFGRYTAGGRGGRVIKVTNLDDDGPGSLRQALREKGPRTVVFDVSGTIALEREIIVKNGFLTIAGQTAPGDGITLKNYGLVIKADEVIIRYIRSRPGSETGVETDAISVSAGTNIIIDHCSASWATDETLTVSPSDRHALRSIDKVTVQWSMITESLNNSVHSKGEHGYGSLVRGSAGARYSFHHNLWAHHKARMPRPGNYADAETDPAGPLFDFRNNVFYNWGGAASGYNADTESVSRYNFVNNYYLRGPDSSKSLAFDEGNSLAESHFSGNFMNGNPPESPWELVRFDDGRQVGSEQPFPVAPVRTQTAPQAFEDVLRLAGASKVRDAVDQRVAGHVRDGKGSLVDDVSEVGGWPLLEGGPGRADTDGDGMHDDWETEQGLDPQNAADGNLDADGNGYTNLEDYINSLITE